MSETVDAYRAKWLTSVRMHSTLALTKLSLNLAGADQAVNADRDQSHGCDRDLCRLSHQAALLNLEVFQATQALSQAGLGACSMTQTHLENL